MALSALNKCMDASFQSWYLLAMLSLNHRDSLTEIPARQVSGISELFWAIRYWRWSRNSQDWEIVVGKVAGREFLRFSSNGGWFSLDYAYVFDGQIHSGELRKWIMPKKTSTAATDPVTVELSKRFPDNAQIQVRVDPQQPDRSVANFSM
jgi:hypothetical protein